MVGVIRQIYNSKCRGFGKSWVFCGIVVAGGWLGCIEEDFYVIQDFGFYFGLSGKFLVFK